MLYLCYAMMVLVVAWFIYAIAAWASHCGSPTNCRLPTVKTCIIIGAIHITYNVIVMVMAIPAVYTIEFFMRKRLSIAVLFLLSTLYDAPSLIS
jgi:hypothetical protein